MSFQTMKQGESQIKGKRQSILVSKMIKENKVIFMHTLISTVENEILMGTQQHILPYGFDLVHVEEIPALL